VAAGEQPGPEGAAQRAEPAANGPRRGRLENRHAHGHQEDGRGRVHDVQAGQGSSATNGQKKPARLLPVLPQQPGAEQGLVVDAPVQGQQWQHDVRILICTLPRLHLLMLCLMVCFWILIC